MLNSIDDFNIILIKTSMLSRPRRPLGQHSAPPWPREPWRRHPLLNLTSGSSLEPLTLKFNRRHDFFLNSTGIIGLFKN